MSITDAELISRAIAVLNPRKISPTVEVDGVGCALLTTTGVLHVGVCIDVTCGIGFCAEHAAVSSMITNGESRIQTLVAVDWDGVVPLRPMSGTDLPDRSGERRYSDSVTCWKGHDFAAVASTPLAFRSIIFSLRQLLRKGAFMQGYAQ